MTLVVGVLLALLALSSTLGAGVELELSRVRGHEQRKPIAAALVANLLTVPLASLLLLNAVDLPESSFVGLLLVALAPGGASAPLLARLAGGEATRVGVIYVALCAGCLVTLGLVMPHVLPARRDSSRVLLVTLALQLLPLALGVVLRVKRAELAARLAVRLRRLGSLLLGIVVVMLSLTRGSFLLTMGTRTLASMLALVLLSLAAGALTSRPRLPDALLACVRNLTLALMIAEMGQPGGATTLVVAAYGLVMYAMASLCLLTQRKIRADTQEYP